MQIHLFRSEGRVFGCTADAAGANLPSKLAPWTAFKTVELQRGVPTPGINPDECLDDIDRFGFHITDAHVRVTEKYL
jgi:hypothetical protein